MSHNIVAIYVLESEDFYLPIEAAMDIPKEECCDNWNGRRAEVQEGRIPWTGERSGEQYQWFCRNVLTKFKGWADLMVIWGNGDMDGIHVRYGFVNNGKSLKVEVE